MSSFNVAVSFSEPLKKLFFFAPGVLTQFYLEKGASEYLEVQIDRDLSPVKLSKRLASNLKTLKNIQY